MEKFDFEFVSIPDRVRGGSHTSMALCEGRHVSIPERVRGGSMMNV